MAEVDWGALVVEQLRWHWESQLRPRLDGLTDDEYFWEPVPGCWSLRPREVSTSPIPAGVGELVADFAIPEPVPAAVTTIAWRLGHMLVGVLGARNGNHFGGPEINALTADWPTTADDALARLDAEYGFWMSNVGALSPQALATPVGEAEGPFAVEPMGALIVHINRELIHHGAEVSLLRDLYAHRTV